MLQTSLPYRITLPDGSSAVVGPDSAEPDFIAHLTRITSDVSWDASDTQIAAGDGMLMGDIYRGGRALVLDLLIAEHDELERARRLLWLQRINGVLRDTSGITLSWREADGWEKEISGLRPAAYVAVNDSWPKEIQVSLKSSSPFALSSEIHSRELNAGSGTINLFNGGNAPASPRFFVYGPCDDFVLTNSDNGDEIIFNAAVADGDYIEINSARRTVLLNGGQNAYGGIDFASTNFFTISPYASESPLVFSTSGSGANTRLLTRWQSAWE